MRHSVKKSRSSKRHVKHGHKHSHKHSHKYSHKHDGKRSRKQSRKQSRKRSCKDDGKPSRKHRKHRKHDGADESLPSSMVSSMPSLSDLKPYFTQAVNSGLASFSDVKTAIYKVYKSGTSGNLTESAKKVVEFILNPANRDVILKYGLVTAIGLAGLYGASVVYKRYKNSPEGTRREKLMHSFGLSSRKSSPVQEDNVIPDVPETIEESLPRVRYLQPVKSLGRPRGSRSRVRRVKKLVLRKVRKSGRPRGSRNKKSRRK